MSDIETLLKAGIVTFKYTKISGSIRKASGTTNTALIPAEFKPKNEIQEDIHSGYIRYFDLDENDWRTFVRDNLIAIL